MDALYRPAAPSAAIPVLHDRILVDIIAELESALSVVETAERRARSPASSTRLNAAAAAVDAAILYLRELRLSQPV
jgi:hypothetical protein